MIIMNIFFFFVKIKKDKINPTKKLINNKKKEETLTTKRQLKQHKVKQRQTVCESF